MEAESMSLRLGISLFIPQSCRSLTNPFFRYIRTGILSKDQFDEVEKSGVEFATVEDAGECALRILSDTSINGRTLFVCARKWAPRGYMDLNIEDYPESLIQEIQEDQMRNAPVDLGLFP
jgi:hypothetical protein